MSCNQRTYNSAIPNDLVENTDKIDNCNLYTAISFIKRHNK